MASMILTQATPFVAPTVPWASLSPVIIVMLGGVIGVLVEAFVGARYRRTMGIVISLVTIVAAFLCLIWRWLVITSQSAAAQGSLPSVAPGAGPRAYGEYVEDSLTVSVQILLVLVAFLAVLVIADRTVVRDGAFAGQPSDRPGSSDEERSDSLRYQRSEMFSLIVFSLVGMMVFPATNSMIMIFVALEVMSLPLYILCATARVRRQLSQEASLKYFLLGAFSSGFMLMGMALLYGYSGSMYFSDVFKVLGAKTGMDLLVVGGVLLVIVGLLFKVGAAPFHAWVPDVYTGAPTPITGFMAATVKLAAFGTILRFYQVIAGHLRWDLMIPLSIIAVLTMVVGTVSGIVQTDVKRMLAYSSIAHAGFILIAVMSLVAGSSAHVLFYLLAYALATVGAFGVVTLVRRGVETLDGRSVTSGEATALERWAGIGQSKPWLAGSMLIFLLSFAGIPLTGGFMGKFVVFADGFTGGLGWLVAIALVCSLATAFFYFRLVRLMFFTEPNEETIVINSEGFSEVAIYLCALGTIILGIFPAPVFEFLSKAAILLP